MTSHAKDVHLVRLTIENFRRIRFAQVEIEEGGRIINVTGDNFSGKTSFLDAINALTGGGKAVPKTPLNDEAESEKGRIYGEYSNGWTIERRFTPKSSSGYLTIVNADGEKSDKQGDLDWAGGISGYPMFLWSLSEKDRNEVLLGLTGEDVVASLAKLSSDIAELEAKRKPFNSEVQRAERTQAPAMERCEPVDITADLAELDRLQAVEGNRAAATTAGALARERAEAADRSFTEKEEALFAARRDLDAAQEALKEADEDMWTAEEGAEARHEQLTAATERYKAIPDPTAEMGEVRSRIAAGNLNEGAIREWAVYDAGQEEAMAAGLAAAVLTDKIKAVAAKKKDLVAGLKTNVPGLSFNEDALPLLEGRELHAASGSQRNIFAFDVLAAKNPQLKIVLLDEGEALDVKSLQKMWERARKWNFHIYLCTLGKDGEGDIVIDDGVARNGGTS